MAIDVGRTSRGGGACDHSSPVDLGNAVLQSFELWVRSE